MALYRKLHKRQRTADRKGWYEVGDIVDLDPETLRFADQWEALELQEEPPPGEPASTSLEIRRRGGGWFDVVNTETGKFLNDKPLRQADALDLVEAG
jgi:hypothetical protein